MKNTYFWFGCHHSMRNNIKGQSVRKVKNHCPRGTTLGMPSRGGTGSQKVLSVCQEQQLPPSTPHTPGRLSKEAKNGAHTCRQVAAMPSMGTKAGGTQCRLELLASRQLVTQDLSVPSQSSLHSLALSGSPTQPV